MSPLEKQVIELLKQDKSYRAIQEELTISPTTISEIKKMYAGELQDNSTIPYQNNETKIVPVASSLVPKIHQSVPINQNNLDSKTIIKLSKMNYNQEIKLKQMDLDEKEKERLHQKEMEERHLEDKRLNARIEEGKNNAIALKEKLANKKEIIEEPDLEEDEESNIDEELDGSDIDPNFDEDFETYIKYLLDNHNDAKCTENHTNEELKKIRDLKKRFKKMRDYEEENVEDYTVWDILTRTENIFKKLRKEIKDSTWRSRATFVLSDDVKETIENYLAE